MCVLLFRLKLHVVGSFTEYRLQEVLYSIIVVTEYRLQEVLYSIIVVTHLDSVFANTTY